MYNKEPYKARNSIANPQIIFRFWAKSTRNPKPNSPEGAVAPLGFRSWANKVGHASRKDFELGDCEGRVARMRKPCMMRGIRILTNEKHTHTKKLPFRKQTHMCVYVCIYIYTHTYHRCVYIYTYIYIYIYTHTNNIYI